MTSNETVLRGRQGEARRNDEAVLAAARSVFVVNPKATMADVATRAGVGQASLYRRYPTKNVLLNVVCAQGMTAARSAAQAALRSPADPWQVFTTFVRSYIASGSALQLLLAGTFAPDVELFALANEVETLATKVVARAIKAGVVRSDVEGTDLLVVTGALAGVRGISENRSRDLSERYLALVLDGFRAPGGAVLPHNAPSYEEINALWSTD